uniref:Uncharacterized protein n=1 Tax=Megaselia scalaris TaxID=36166 RepID=T1H1I7_MEGSC
MQKPCGDREKKFLREINMSDVAAATIVESTKEQKITEAKELYSKGSRNFLVKSYDEAADQLSQCAPYTRNFMENFATN